jgi:hypothetical protein
LPSTSSLASEAVLEASGHEPPTLPPSRTILTVYVLTAFYAPDPAPRAAPRATGKHMKKPRRPKSAGHPSKSSLLFMVQVLKRRSGEQHPCQQKAPPAGVGPAGLSESSTRIRGVQGAAPLILRASRGRQAPRQARLRTRSPCVGLVPIRTRRTLRRLLHGGEGPASFRRPNKNPATANRAG